MLGLSIDTKPFQELFILLAVLDASIILVVAVVDIVIIVVVAIRVVV